MVLIKVTSPILKSWRKNWGLYFAPPWLKRGCICIKIRVSLQLNKPAYLLDTRVFPCIIGGYGSFEFDSVVSQMRRQNRISDSNLSRICHGADRGQERGIPDTGPHSGIYTLSGLDDGRVLFHRYTRPHFLQTHAQRSESGIIIPSVAVSSLTISSHS